MALMKVPQYGRHVANQLCHRLSCKRYQPLGWIARISFAATATALNPFSHTAFGGVKRWNTNFSDPLNDGSIFTINEKNLHLSSANRSNACEILQALAHRFQEPSPLRAPSSDRLSQSEEKHRLSELAADFVRGYVCLPPLRLQSSTSLGENEFMADCQRRESIIFLATQCGPSPELVEGAVQHYQRLKSLDEAERKDETDHNATKNLVMALSRLRKTATPLYEEILEFILKQNSISGMSFLVSFREDLMQLILYRKHQDMKSSVTASTKSADVKGYGSYNAAMISQLKDLDMYLKSLFVTWFTPGMLELRRITYENTSASIIETIATKEAVHPMKSLDDLRRRLGPGRRVFALFHPLLPERPLVFVHVALIPSKEGQQNSDSLIPTSMKEAMNLVDLDARPSLWADGAVPRVATFYSISNGVKGLAGVGLGEYLLKGAVQVLKDEMPTLEVFVTLSPMPQFRKWLQVKILQHKDDSLLSWPDRQALAQSGFVSASNNSDFEIAFPWEEFWDRLESVDLDVLKEQNQQQYEVLRKVLSKLTTRYLMLEKHHGKPLDNVARFHVSNGAQVQNVNFAADLSRNGMSNSFGMMVNYLYDLHRLQLNQAQFESHFTVPASQNVLQWLDNVESRSTKS